MGNGLARCRYEVDDFIGSPPSHEDGDFLRLRYGRNRDHDMAHHEAGQDGGMTVEVCVCVECGCVCVSGVVWLIEFYHSLLCFLL